jgi:hypothetical protein
VKAVARFAGKITPRQRTVIVLDRVEGLQRLISTVPKAAIRIGGYPRDGDGPKKNGPPKASRSSQPESKKVARASDTPAPSCTATVAPFRAWRGSRLAVAGAPARTGVHCPSCDPELKGKARIIRASLVVPLLSPPFP